MGSRYFLVIPALIVDGLQAMLSLGLAGVFASPAAIPVVGTALATATAPLGIILGFVLNFAIAIVFGAGIIMFFGFCGMFYPRYLISGFGELVPGLNNLPFWTVYAILSIRQKNKEEEMNEHAQEEIYANA